MVADNKTIYATCNGVVYKIGWDDSYGNYIIVKDNEQDYFHWFCHLSEVKIGLNKKVDRLTIIGIMGATGNATGVHLHYEIRNKTNKYGQVIDPADYMKIPNKVGNYNSQNYQLEENKKEEETSPQLKTLIRATNLRSEPTLNSKNKVLYKANTTLYVIKSNVCQCDGYMWDLVKIRVNNKEGYMINKNYK